jgi:hypothetical protein
MRSILAWIFPSSFCCLLRPDDLTLQWNYRARSTESLERNEMPCALLHAVRFVTAMAWMCGAQMRPSRQGNLEVRSTV